MKFLHRSVENKKIIWFEESNRYLLVEMPAYEVLRRLSEGWTKEKVARWCTATYGLPKPESLRFTGEVMHFAEEQSRPDNTASRRFLGPEPTASPQAFYSCKTYSLNGAVISVKYASESIEYLFHPKFAHLEVAPPDMPGHDFRVFQHLGRYVLQVNGSVIGQYLEEDVHFLTGRFSMELVNRMYDKTLDDWLGVFHASAISDGDSSVMFLGDSGHGKSTVSAILMASGFDLLADDFVPVDAATHQVFYFPSAVSVKKKALSHLIPIYPELDSAAEFYYPDLDKTVRYLAPAVRSDDRLSSYPCKALIFIRYEPDSGMSLTELPADIAFQHLVPDSWISPLARNASWFMDWFLGIPSYQLIYSDDARMVAAIRKLFRDEL